MQEALSDFNTCNSTMDSISSEETPKLEGASLSNNRYLAKSHRLGDGVGWNMHLLRVATYLSASFRPYQPP